MATTYKQGGSLRGASATGLAFILLGSLALYIIISAILTGFLVRFLDHGCLLEPWHLVFKTKQLWYSAFVAAWLAVAPNTTIARLLGLTIPSALSKGVFMFLLVFSAFGFFYTTHYYGSPGYGACANPGINKDYYKHPNQEMFFDR